MPWAPACCDIPDSGRPGHLPGGHAGQPSRAEGGVVMRERERSASGTEAETETENRQDRPTDGQFHGTTWSEPTGNTAGIREEWDRGFPYYWPPHSPRGPDNGWRSMVS